jgi:hypothetical protein
MLKSNDFMFFIMSITEGTENTACTVCIASCTVLLLVIKAKGNIEKLLFVDGEGEGEGDGDGDGDGDGTGGAGGAVYVST